MDISTPQAPDCVTPRDLQQRIASGAACELLDVRTPPEHASAHVPGVRLVPLDELDAAAYLAQRADRNAPLYVLCQAGGRAKKAIEKFKATGFHGCVLVEGGTAAWIAAGLPVERGTSRVLPLQRQVHLVLGLLAAVGALLALTVDPLFSILSLVTGFGLLIHATTGWCGLALLMAKMPWNRSANL